MQPTINSICAKLQQKAYKITPQRQIILQVFLQHSKRHLSAEEVHAALLQTHHPEIGLATVYRTLEILVSLDILHKIEFGDGCTRYEFAEEKVHYHHHLICVNCGKVTEFNDDLLETLETWIAKQTKFQIIDHQVKFYGYCRDCQRKD